MIYRSVCSGIEAPSVAWGPLGWTAQSFSEIDPFCCALLKHYYPEVPNHGDFTTQIENEEPGSVDVLVAGTPCQSFSVAGKRGGLGDARGNLALEFLRLAQRIRPRWILFENVPGLLSNWSDAEGSRGAARRKQLQDFDSFLACLGECGYQCAWRKLDAQYSGLAQRRERLWVVGYLGDWRPPTAVLFESESLQRNSPPGRKAREEVAGTIGGGSSERGWCDDTDRATFVAHAVNAKGGSGRSDYESETFVTCPLTGNPYGDDAARESLLVAHTLKAEGSDASEDGTGRGVPLVAVPLKANSVRNQIESQYVAFSCKDNGRDAGELAPTLRALEHRNSHANGGGQVAVQQAMAVRRLTPRECERLMGFPDDYTLIPYRKKPAKDGPRYRAIGNSMAVTELRWLGQRIQFVDRLLQSANAGKPLAVSIPGKSAKA